MFRVEDGSVDAVEETVEGKSRVLYEFELEAGSNGFVQSLVESRGRLLGAEGTVDAWDIRIQFADRGDVASFREACERRGLSVTLKRLYDPTTPEPDGPLTSKRSEALMTAHRAGYFEVPRRTTMGALADEFGISNSALSQRIRRGTAVLVAESLLGGGEERS